MFRVKVYGPSTNSQWGQDVFQVASQTDVRDIDGVLVIHIGPNPGRAGEDSPSRFVPAIKATRSSQAIYPRGGWTKVVIADVVD